MVEDSTMVAPSFTMIVDSITMVEDSTMVAPSITMIVDSFTMVAHPVAVAVDFVTMVVDSNSRFCYYAIVLILRYFSCYNNGLSYYGNVFRLLYYDTLVSVCEYIDLSTSLSQRINWCFIGNA